MFRSNKGAQVAGPLMAALKDSLNLRNLSESDAGRPKVRHFPERLWDLNTFSSTEIKNEKRKNEALTKIKEDNANYGLSKYVFYWIKKWIV